MVRAIRYGALAGCSALALAFAAQGAQAADPATATPIKHLVVIFQENVSFDHYFATYPKAANPAGEPAFTASADTPAEIDTLATAGLLSGNPNNTNADNGTDAADPFRLDRTQAGTADQNHGYAAEQAAYDGYKMDLFPKNTGRGTKGGAGAFGTKGLVMGYYDGNTVTALWNYAQHFAMSDNSFSTTFGPSTPGAINLISGQTNGMILPEGYKLEKDGTYDGGRVVPDGHGNWTMISDLDPTGDVCSNPMYPTALMAGRNIGDLLNTKGVTWGWFEGGFDLTAKNADGSTGCARTTTSSLINVRSGDYIPHHQPFQYYASTANLQHVRPSSVAAIGTANDGGANHQYDMTDFWAALDAGNFPAVSFLKAPAYQDGHAAYSDPLDEQEFVVDTINRLEKTPDWKSTAVVILYDDSDGWYDHAHAVVNPSNIPVKGYDVLNGDACSNGTPLPGIAGIPVEGRCGYGTRQPLLVVSPYAKTNYVDHTLTDQTSVTKFIEDNWLGGERIGQGSFDAIAGTLDTCSTGRRATPRRSCSIRRPARPCSRVGPMIARYFSALFVIWRSRARRSRAPAPPGPATAMPPPMAAEDVGALSAVARLGARIFFDPSLSGSGKLACASCHDPAHAYAPANDRAVQLGGPDLARPGIRTVPSLTYKLLTPAFSVGPESPFEVEPSAMPGQRPAASAAPPPSERLCRQPQRPRQGRHQRRRHRARGRHVLGRARRHAGGTDPRPPALTLRDGQPRRRDRLRQADEGAAMRASSRGFSAPPSSPTTS